MVLYNAVDFLTAKVWQTSNERTEADFTGKCSYIEILHIHHAYSKCEYSGFVCSLCLLEWNAELLTSCVRLYDMYLFWRWTVVYASDSAAWHYVIVHCLLCAGHLCHSNILPILGFIYSVLHGKCLFCHQTSLVAKCYLIQYCTVLCIVPSHLCFQSVLHNVHIYL